MTKLLPEIYVATNESKEPEAVLIEYLEAVEGQTKQFEYCKPALKNLTKLKMKCQSALEKRRNALLAQEASQNISNTVVTQRQTATKETLLEMLNLEARVIKARTILTRSETELLTM